MSKLERPPSPRELLRAYRTLRRLAWAIPYEAVVDAGGSPAWDGLVEGRRMLAVSTSYLATLDTPEAADYRAVWEEMIR